MNRLLALGILISMIAAVFSRCDCMNRIVLLIDVEDFRIISSPDYPRYYCPSLSCTWRIVGPSNTSAIYFYADNLDLRDGIDFIEFYDHQFLMPNEKVPPTHVCTGISTCKFTATDNIMTIKFTTGDGETQNFGFQGTVAGHNRRMRELKAAVGRYSIPVAISVILFCALCTLVFYVRRRSIHSARDQLDEDDLPEEKLLPPNLSRA